MPRFLHSTPAQLHKRVREEFRQAKGVRLHKIASWLNTNLTDVQLKNIFNLTGPQTATLKNKLNRMAARLEAFDGEAGD